MKICIPAETKNGLLSKVYGHFGSAPYFFIYDTNEKNYTMLENTNSHHSHGSCRPLQYLKAYGFDTVICRGMGQGAFQKLKEAGIKIFVCEEETAEDVLKKYNEGCCREITEEITCRGHGCH